MLRAELTRTRNVRNNLCREVKKRYFDAMGDRANRAIASGDMAGFSREFKSASLERQAEKGCSALVNDKGETVIEGISEDKGEKFD